MKCKAETHIVGHSLGGGLAALGSAATGISATTSNPAGLHAKSLERLGIDKKAFVESIQNDSIRNYVVKGEVLDRVNNLPLTPKPIGVSNTLNSELAAKAGIFGRHKMKVVVDILNEATGKTAQKPDHISREKLQPETLSKMVEAIQDPARRQAAERSLEQMQAQKNLAAAPKKSASQPTKKGFERGD